MNDQVFGYATSKALKEAKHTNAGLRDQRAAFDCQFRKGMNESTYTINDIQGFAIILKPSAETQETSLQWVKAWVLWLLACTSSHMQALKEYHFRKQCKMTS